MKKKGEKEIGVTPLVIRQTFTIFLNFLVIIERNKILLIGNIYIIYKVYFAYLALVYIQVEANNKRKKE